MRSFGENICEPSSNRKLGLLVDMLEVVDGEGACNGAWVDNPRKEMREPRGNHIFAVYGGLGL